MMTSLVPRCDGPTPSRHLCNRKYCTVTILYLYLRQRLVMYGAEQITDCLSIDAMLFV